MNAGYGLTFGEMYPHIALDTPARKLTDAKLRTLTTPGKHFDGGGLYLDVTKAGGRYWRMKYRRGGKEKLMAFGVYPAVSLKDARDLAAAARKALQAGDDPAELRKADKARVAHETANTLQAVAADWMKHQASRWETETADRIRASLEADVFPTLGARAMAGIKPGEVMAAVKKIEARGTGRGRPGGPRVAAGQGHLPLGSHA